MHFHRTVVLQPALTMIGPLNTVISSKNVQLLLLLLPQTEKGLINSNRETLPPTTVLTATLQSNGGTRYIGMNAGHFVGFTYSCGENKLIMGVNVMVIKVILSMNCSFFRAEQLYRIQL